MQKKTILITGANRGIAYAACLDLLSKGHRLIATARDPHKGKTAVDEFKSKIKNADVHFAKLDVTNLEDIENCRIKVQQEFGTLDCLINCSGILYKNILEETTHEQLTSVLNTNLVGPFMLSQKMLALLKKSDDPIIINVSSQLGSIQNAGERYAAYRISKSALNSMTKVLHHDLIDVPVKVFSVCPGWVHTAMGGPEAPRTPEQGAKSILYPFYSQEAISGSFYQDGKVHAW